MQREIKFRAWMSNDKEMLDPVDLNTMCILNGGLGISESAILMQYTGLKDKNGVEIYEGDIVGVSIKEEVFTEENTSYFEQDDQGNRKRINCDKKPCQVVFKNGEYGFYHKRTGTFKGVWIEVLNQKDWEVIGNIYENPELCK